MDASRVESSEVAQVPLKRSTLAAGLGSPFCVREDCCHRQTGATCEWPVESERGPLLGVGCHERSLAGDVRHAAGEHRC
jgi:hypothetical protein